MGEEEDEGWVFVHWTANAVEIVRNSSSEVGEWSL
jgi:hypothetical protein